MIDNPETLEEKMQNIQELVHQYLPDMPVEWANIRRTLGRCCYKRDEEGHKVPYLIQISRPMAKVNSWDAIKLIVLHEIAHALAPGHGHDSVWKAKCVEIGGSPDVYATDAEDPRPGFNTSVKHPPLTEKSAKKRKTATRKQPSADRYIKVCSKCGKMGGYASRKTSMISYHTGCNGQILLMPNPLFGIEDYDADRLFTQLKERIVEIFASNSKILGIAKPKPCEDHMYVLCKEVPTPEERQAMYDQAQGLYEHYQFSESWYDGPGVADAVTVKYRSKELFIFYTTSDDLWMYIDDVFTEATGPQTFDYSPKFTANFMNLDILSESGECWSKIVRHAFSGPAYTYKRWCRYELELTVERSEHYGSSVKNDLWPQLPAFISLLKAMHYLNRKMYTNVCDFEKPEAFEVFEKQPKDFGERYLNTLKLLHVKGNGVRIENELKKLVEEIRELLGEG